MPKNFIKIAENVNNRRENEENSAIKRRKINKKMLKNFVKKWRGNFRKNTKKL